MERKRNIGPLLIILAGIFWGSMGIFVRKLGTYGFTSVQIVAIRITLAALVFSIVLFIRDRSGFRITLRDLPLFLGLGFGSILFFTVCYFTAITIMPLSTAAILLYTSPIWIMLMSMLFFRRRDYAGRPADRSGFRHWLRALQYPGHHCPPPVFSLYRHNLYLPVCCRRLLADLQSGRYDLKVHRRG